MADRFVIPTVDCADFKDMCPITLTVEKNTPYRKECDVFVEYASRLGADFSYVKGGFIRALEDPTMEHGEYGVNVDAQGIGVYASDTAGISRGFATVLQLIQHGENGFSAPGCNIRDRADNAYRGLMVDLARVWRPFEYLLDFVDICYYYKLSVLHLHFTDDQGYTLPSDIYPKLSTPGKHYTKEQIAYLVDYADRRGVMLMPEIDVPGHCRPFTISYPEIFGSGRIIEMHPKAIEGIKALFSEVCDMFPNSRTVHIGGDEAAIGDWAECEECVAYAREKGIDTEDKRLLSEALLAEFISESASAVFEKGRIPIVWEGFSKEMNDRISRDIVVMSWENYYQLTPDLLDAGFEIINCTWRPMYIVSPVVVRPLEETFDWSIYKWCAVHPESPFLKKIFETEPDDAILGGQLLVWSDTVISKSPTVEQGIANEMRHLLERVPYAAENTWNTEKKLKFEEFMPLAERLGKRLCLLLRNGVIE